MTNSRISAIGRQFNRSSNSYDTHAHVQRTMAHQLVRSLIGWKNKRFIVEPNILEIGCGTGSLTQMVVKEWPSAKITALDVAPEMIEVAMKRVQLADDLLGTIKSSSGRIRFIHADIENWAADAPASSYDYIVSNACFQWLSNPEDTLGHLQRMLRPGGILLFSTFGPDTFNEMHRSFHEVYRAFGMEPQRHGLSFHSTLQWQHMIEESGYANFNYKRYIHMEKYASARDFLHSVKAMGASTSEAVTMKGQSLRRLFTNMYKEYEGEFSIEGGVAATYDLLIIQSIKNY
ncbi:malonyl-[acyl-carrier protein] O-methyltransferase BioC [Paenibacillus sp. FSL H8-0548]|uniref:malonyl-ACP O-methyltransferase BioC n=1 Tax=Paenibacillus sp. FSL H8-0548 TaxID=1920422 RepID=UPI00096ED68B|nr:malonyl-ACP O-methyltransferase BioC [Paenibacillus sp. FSL H8-0548]OMF23256.1 malonyl-[acyl-carrier protein] O-methyltransferase BioC [Paenibacillus sp. FSL H8-0548]